MIICLSIITLTINRMNDAQVYVEQKSGKYIQDKLLSDVMNGIMNDM